MEFREALITLANAQDERGFAVEAASQRDHVVQDVRRAEETLKSFPYQDSNVALTLEAVGRFAAATGGCLGTARKCRRLAGGAPTLGESGAHPVG